MRRQKRDKSSRAFIRGYQNGVNGKTRDLCPYHDDGFKQAWLNGWRSGREDQWDGYVGVAGVSKNHLA
jgi:ribosome modulation factor|tara:strand:- start:782 stop:985 length:204 start_codon:yes stop_codon:yes gene_type:complete